MQFLVDEVRPFGLLRAYDAGGQTGGRCNGAVEKTVASQEYSRSHSEKFQKFTAVVMR
jgi:hypothetical protein